MLQKGREMPFASDEDLISYETNLVACITTSMNVNVFLLVFDYQCKATVNEILIPKL